jgi:lantibiotic modifying enzyme
MKHVLSQIDVINKILAENFLSESQVGLLNGKLGASIYFFSLARETKLQRYQRTAEHLIGEVYHSVGEVTISPDFEDGLAGIAWGVCYLVENQYVDAELDEILTEVDDRIYRHLNDNIDNLPVNVRQGILGYLLYYLYRLSCASSSGDATAIYIYQRTCAELINHLGQLIDEDKFQSREPILFTIFWDLPIILMLLAAARKLDINADKVDRILDYLSPLVTSLYPNLHGNRLYLLLGMEHILKELPIPEWRTYADFLRKTINPSIIIHDECKSLNILLSDGITGLAFISKKMGELTGDSELLLCWEEVAEKILKSIYWNDIGFQNEMKKSIGLGMGLSGIGLFLLKILENKNEVDFV